MICSIDFVSSELVLLAVGVAFSLNFSHGLIK